MGARHSLWQVRWPLDVSVWEKNKNIKRRKDRCTTNGLVHFVRRRSNYRYQSCNGVIVYNATDDLIPLTCFQCIVRALLEKRK